MLTKYLDDLVLVSEDEIRMAFSFVLERTKQLIEPSSATTVAAILYNKLNMKRKNIVTLPSSGNVYLKNVQGLIVVTAKFSQINS